MPTSDAGSEIGGGFPGRLRHAAMMLAVRDVEVSVAFYRDALGFEQLPYPHIPLLRCGGLLLHLVEHSPPTEDKPTVTLTAPVEADTTPVNLVLEVNDAHSVHAALRRRGVRFLTPPVRPPWGGWRCFARDPDGYLIEIEQPPVSDAD